ncbi:MAG: hypothetical protein WCH84_11720 [Verrucomicrobiota bacterium]
MKTPEPQLAWKPDWAAARATLTDWWEHRALALHVTAPKDQPWENIPHPGPPRDLQQQWTDVPHWVARYTAQAARTFYGGVAFPRLWADIGGPGSLGLFLGAVGKLAPTTVWYEPVIHDPESFPALRLDKDGDWWRRHFALIDLAQQQAQGRYLVGFPDLIENIDTLAQLRDGQLLLTDLLERPEWVQAKLAEINTAFFACYDAFWQKLRDPWGGAVWDAFELWAPGKLAKLQCDFSCMISEKMFREFVVPGLTEQCEWLDYSLYHLDGTNAIHQLNALLEIEALDAIEWTPQAGLPGGGSPQWYDLYRRIKAAGKSVQAVGVQPDEVAPLIEAVGAEGLFIWTSAPTEAAARAMLHQTGWQGAA